MRKRYCCSCRQGHFIINNIFAKIDLVICLKQQCCKPASPQDIALPHSVV